MKKLKFIAALGFAISLASCSNYLDVNNNPNAPAQTVPDPVLAGAIVETARIYSNDVTPFSAPWSGYWSFSGTYSSAGAVGENYKLLNSTGFVQNPWNNIYLNLSNYNFVKTAAAAGKGMEFYGAISQIMMVYGFHTLVDCYNDIAYTNALQGFKNLNPTYDAGQSVYADLISKLDDAVANIKAAQAVSTTKAVPKTTDVMFGGDMNKWIQLANTMRLRLLLRQSELSGQASYISGEIAKLVADGADFLSTDAQINPGYTKANGQQNPFFENNGMGVGGDIGGRDYFRTSAYSLQFFQNNQDPRVDYIFRRPGAAPGTNDSDKSYFSIPWGTPPTTEYVSAVTSGFGIGVMPGPSAPVTFLSAAESMFLQAEAVQRGWLTGDAQSLYEAGIGESFRLLGVSDPYGSAQAYYTNGIRNCDWSASSDKLQAIIVQKWAANTSINTMESWCDLRRTGFPNDLPQSLDPNRVGPGTPPVRLLYPQSEYNVNSAAVSGYTINVFTSKVFWQP